MFYPRLCGGLRGLIFPYPLTRLLIYVPNLPLLGSQLASFFWLTAVKVQNIIDFEVEMRR